MRRRLRSGICAFLAVAVVLVVAIIVATVGWRRLSTGTGVLKGHTAPVTSVTFSPNGTMLASASEDGMVRLWDSSKRQELGVLRSDGSAVWAVAFASDGKILATGCSDGTVRLWEVKTGREFNSFRSPRVPWNPSVRMEFCSLGFSADGKALAGGARNSDDDHLALNSDNILWDVETGTMILEVPKLLSVSPVVALTPDGRILAVNGSGVVRFVEVATGEERTSLRIRSAGPLALSGDGKTLAVVEITGSTPAKNTAFQVQLWDWAAGKQVAAFPKQSSWIRSLAFAANGGVVAWGSEDGTVTLGDVSRSQGPITRQGHTGWVNTVALSVDGKWLASGGNDGLVRLWDVSKLLKRKADGQ
jgi:WD40 repeat protein